MVDLAQWLETHLNTLTEVAVVQLSQDENLKIQVVTTVETFYTSLIKTCLENSILPLNSILRDWVKSRSGPTETQSASLVPLLATLKSVVWNQIQEACPADQAVFLLTEIDGIFTEAVIFLSGIESEALIEDMRSRLHKAQAHVKRLDKSKSNFIAVAAHELRTPLTLVEGYADMVANSQSMTEDAQLPLLMEGISSGTKRLREIINDLIDVSLLDLKLMELHFQPVWLLQVLNAAERSVSKLLVNRSVELVIERQTIPVNPTFADPDRLLQAAQKVLMNAVKYTPDGGKIAVRARDLPGFTDITVEDTGIGIDPSNLPHIFDSFSALGDASLHSSGKTKFKGGGPGLGLPIAKGIIEAHGGTIWAESEGYNEQTYPGSIFHIMIPMYTTTPDDMI
ncbi:MAG: HAMP domain-containing sensor histidine kinase [Chloroflexota bacterium]